MKKTQTQKSEIQTLFDEMFAMAVDDNKQPIYPDRKQSTASPDRHVQVDPMDAILLLRDPITAMVSSGGGDSSKARDCLERLNRCHDMVNNSNRGERRLTVDDLAFINSFIADAQTLLNPTVLDDTSWGGIVPAPLRLKGIVGGLDLVDIEKEEVFMVRGASYLQDCEKVRTAPWQALFAANVVAFGNIDGFVFRPLSCLLFSFLPIAFVFFPSCRCPQHPRCSTCAACRSWSSPRASLRAPPRGSHCWTGAGSPNPRTPATSG